MVLCYKFINMCLRLYTPGLSVLTTALVKHWCLGKLQVYMFCRKVAGIHEQDFKKMWRFLPKNLVSTHIDTSIKVSIVFYISILLRKVSIVSIPVSILVPYYIAIQEISDKLKKIVRNVLEILNTNIWNILIMISWNLWENLGAILEIGT